MSSCSSESGRDRKYRLGLSSGIFASILSDGTFYPDLIGLEDPRPLEFIGLYDGVRQKPWSECVILDVGCGEGPSSAALARTGARVIGLDARPAVLRRAEFQRDDLGYSNLEFRVADALDSDQWPGEIDAVFASGLIHHLSNPLALMKLCGERCRDFAYFCTHLSPTRESEGRASFFGDRLFDFATVDVEGRRRWGCWFREGSDVREDQDEGCRHPRSGVGNEASWWPSLDSFVSEMKRCGFPDHRHVSAHEHRLRHRLCFSRRGPIPEPRDLDTQLLLSAPERLDRRTATERAQDSDARFLRSLGRPIPVLGAEPAISRVEGRLRELEIPVGKIFSAAECRGESDWRVVLEGLLETGSPHVVLAANDLATLRDDYRRCMIRGAFEYAFASFSLLLTERFDPICDPVTGEQMKLQPERGMLF